MEFGPLVLQRTRGRTEIRKDLGKDDKGHKGTERGAHRDTEGGWAGFTRRTGSIPGIPLSLVYIGQVACMHAPGGTGGGRHTMDSASLSAAVTAEIERQQAR